MANQFSIGDKVQVKAYVSFGYDEDRNRIYEREPVETPVIGFVVGLRHRQLGKYKPPHYYGSLDGGECEAAYLQVSGTVPVWLVTTGLRNKAKDVLDDDLRKA